MTVQASCAHRVTRRVVPPHAGHHAQSSAWNLVLARVQHSVQDSVRVRVWARVWDHVKELA